MEVVIFFIYEAGLDKGLSILYDVKQGLGCPIITDIHEPSQAKQSYRSC